MAKQKLTVELGVDNSKFKKGLDGATGMLTKFASAAGIAFGVTEVIRFGVESAKLAAKAESVKNAFDRLDSPTLLQDLRRATKNTVSDVELMTNAIRARNFRLPLEQLPKYFEFATRRARETGDSVNYLVDSIVLGISRESPKILDNLGLSLAEINEELKKTPDYATAVGNIIERELAKAGDAADDAGIKFMTFSASWANFKEGIGGAVNRSGLPKLLERWAIQMRILGDESMTASQKIAMLFATRIDKSAYNNYVEHISRLQKEVSGFNWASGQAAKMGFSTGFNMLAGIPAPQRTTLGDLNDELDNLEAKLLELDITNKEEIQSTLKQIEAKKKLIDTIMGVTEAVKGNKREIMDAEQVWNTLVLPAKAGQQLGGTWGALSNKFADPTQLAEVSNKVTTVTDDMRGLWSISNQITGTFDNLFSAGIMGWDEFGKAAVGAIQQMLVQLAALAATYAVLSLIPGFSAFIETVGGFSGFMRQGMGWGSATNNIANVSPLGSTQRLEIVGRQSGYDLMWTTARAGNRFNNHT